MVVINIFEKFIYFLQEEITRPKIYGWFHLLWLLISIVFIIYFVKYKNYTEKKLKTILLIYGVGAFILEILKQISWSMNYDPVLNNVTWSYTWYSAPFQLCTTPIYVSLICLFLKKSKLRDSLLSYMAFTTILGSIMTMVYPESCFVKELFIDIHTMYLHAGSLLVSLYIIISNEIDLNKKNLINGYKVFLIIVIIAEILNIVIYKSGILNGQTFNMFYISPYFISSLPVFDIIQKNTPFIIFFIIYLFAIFIGSYIVYKIAKLSKK